MDAKEPGQQRFEQRQPKRVLRVAPGLLRPFVDFHEDAVNAGSDAGRGQWQDELRLPGSDTVSGAWELKAVGHVVDHRIAQRSQNRKASHVDDKVVISE